MSKKNPLKELCRFGVSVWYDNISRGFIKSGELARLIKEDGLRGVTSNPTIFEKAIGGSQDYDAGIFELARKGLGPQEIFEHLAVEDIRAAADLFRPVYDESHFQDGYVSLEVSPTLARDAKRTHSEAVRLHKLVGRPNVMIKIPGTREGLEAIEAAIADGVPINVTLLFSQQRYAEVVEAYFRGLEKRAAAKKDLSRLASVASFFVSRVDTAIDAQLKDESLKGKAAIANAKLAYEHFKHAFSSPRFAKLRAAGAQLQRLLWASTGTKNPKYSDVLYVEELIGSPTVNTMPPATVDAFRDHGSCRPSLEDGALEARRVWKRLPQAGINLDGVMATLEDEGIKSFAKSFETLMGQIAAKKELIQAEAGVIEGGLEELKRAMFASRLWNKDASLWKEDKDHQRIIKNALGWLTVADAMAAGLGTIRSFVKEAQADGFQTAVVLGMGGSSLCCEVFRTCFPQGKGALKLEVLDSTHPRAVAALESRIKLGKTLFIVSSKSGSTIEPNCYMDYFFARCQKAGGDAGRQFVAITDPGTSLEKHARAQGFRKVFLNPSDIGGRYSALSYFGLVPAALMGVEVGELLDRARRMSKALAPSAPTEENPALRLGAAMGRHASRGQDKLTLCLPPAFESFGLWIEQLIAESTGKEGRGIVPVHGEPLGAPSEYNRDRFFVRLELEAPKASECFKLAELDKAGHPALVLKLKDAYDLGAQFLLWETATAAAGFLIKVDPFDQPNVQAAKDQTNKLLQGLTKGQLPPEPAGLRAGNLAGYCDDDLLRRLNGSGKKAPQTALSQALGSHVGRLKAGDYVAVLAYLEPSEGNASALEELRARLRRLTKAPVCVEFGPRYLHSTGQLYKGGAATGLFLQLVDSSGPDLPVPGRGFSFSTLLEAQARGEFAAMIAAKRRVLRLSLGPAGEAPLRALANALEELCAQPR